MSVGTQLPPTLFDLEPVTHERVYGVAASDPWRNGDCADCQKPLRTLPTTHLCGGTEGGNSFLLCDDCASIDLLPNGQPRWGITASTLTVDRIRRQVYASGGGETEVRAALIAEGVVKRCEQTWQDEHPSLPHAAHSCVFYVNRPHSRHECKCGLNRHESKS